MAVQTKLNEVHTKGVMANIFQYSLSRLPKEVVYYMAHSFRCKFRFASFQKQKKYMVYDHFHDPISYGKIQTKKEPSECLDLAQDSLAI